MFIARSSVLISKLRRSGMFGGWHMGARDFVWRHARGQLKPFAIHVMLPHAAPTELGSFPWTAFL
jgi:hypothetical protein